MYSFFLKRFFDFIFSFIAFILFFPLFLIISIYLFFSNKGRVFFFQRRPGLNEKVFTIMKFKTMTDEKDQEGKLLPNEKRITKVGQIIRKTSLDEIPQLINVIKGDMSLIGPRPLLVEYLDYYNEEQKLRHTVKPGITGWAQVNGRNLLSWNKKFELDVWYSKELSFFLDMKILFLTVLKVFKSEGVNKGSGKTMEKFRG